MFDFNWKAKRHCKPGRKVVSSKWNGFELVVEQTWDNWTWDVVEDVAGVSTAGGYGTALDKAKAKIRAERAAWALWWNEKCDSDLPW